MGDLAVEDIPNCMVSDEELLAEISSVKYPEGRDKPIPNKQFKGIERLIQQYDKEVRYDTKKLRLTRYVNYIGVVNTNFQMTRYQKVRARFVINKIGNFKKVCKNCSYESIVTSICIWLMRNDGRKVRIATNKFCKDIGLSENRYTSIIEKLLNLNI